MLRHVHGHQKLTCDTSESFPAFPGERDVPCGHKKSGHFMSLTAFTRIGMGRHRLNIFAWDVSLCWGDADIQYMY